MDEQSNTHWKLSEVCQHMVNYVQTKSKTKCTLLQLYWINKVIGIAKPSAKIYIAIFHCAGHPSGDNSCYPPASHLRRVRPGQPGHVRGGRAGEGSQWTAIAHPARASAPAAAGAGRVHCAGRRVCPRGLPPCPSG